MSVPDRFFDTNVLLYLVSADEAKAETAEALISEGGHISVQVLNEFTAVATRKMGMTHAQIREALEPIRMLCKLHPITEAMHDLGMQLAERYGFSIYDAMIVAAALEAGCTTLLSEDMQADLLIGRSLRIRNPFHKRTPR